MDTNLPYAATAPRMSGRGKGAPQAGALARRRPVGIGRAAGISVGIHLFVLLSLILVIPTPLPPPAPPDNAVEVEFEGTADSAQKSDAHGHHAAVAEAEQPAHDLPAEKPPTEKPIQAPTAPPPPPPPAPPLPQPEQVTKFEKTLLPPPTPSVSTITLKPPPPMKVAAHREPPTPAKPADTVTHQPHPTKVTSTDSHAQQVNLDQIMKHIMKDLPPTHTVNAERGGAHDAGGQTHGNLTGLNAAQVRTIGSAVKPCYSEDTEAKNYSKYSVMISVTVDASGEARVTSLSPSDQARANSDPAFRAFAERAEHAVMSPACAKLPIPRNLLGKPSQTFDFRFSP